MACAISLSHREVSYCRQPPRRTAPCAPAFKRRIISELPSLGWLFQFNPASSGELICGSSVQVTDNGFHEGCWAKFPDENPEAVATIFGSGMQTRNGKWLFLTASHPLESLFFSRHSKGWSVSNSLSFLVAYHRLKMPWDARYGATFASISKGIDAYEKRLFGSGDDVRKAIASLPADQITADLNAAAGYVAKLPADTHYFLVQTENEGEAATTQKWAPRQAHQVTVIRDYHKRKMTLFEVRP